MATVEGSKGVMEGRSVAASTTGPDPGSPPIAPHRAFDEAEFWRKIPGYAALDAETFLDPSWQSRNTVRSPQDLARALGPAADERFLEDLRAGIVASAMAVRVSPYIVGLIDWSEPVADPLRRQFLPLASEREPDHPALVRDSLAEQAHSPVPGLTRRYPDKALFLALDTCPVYCSFCTRSYAVGPDTDAVRKVALRVDRTRWAEVFRWLAENPDVEDVVVSGGDAYNLTPSALREIAANLLAIDSIRRVRIATKGLAVLPSRIGRDADWTAAIVEWAAAARQQMVQVSLHTHFNHPREITWVTRAAMQLLFREGVVVRNQSVLLRGVNDDAETMALLVKRLGYLQIQPYYVYLHDMVAGAETFRTSLQTALDIDIEVRGRTAGFNTPTFVVDLPGGGGKRSVHSYESYDRASGVSVFRSPAIAPERLYRYHDPVR
jgi:lysine 2,3-aminomutase